VLPDPLTPFAGVVRTPKKTRGRGSTQALWAMTVHERHERELERCQRDLTTGTLNTSVAEELDPQTRGSHRHGHSPRLSLARAG